MLWKWHMVRIDGDEEVISVSVAIDPGVLVAVLRPRLEASRGLAESLDAASGEVMDTELVTHCAHLGIVFLIEQPDVQPTVVANFPRRFEGRPDDVDRLSRWNDRGQKRDASANFRDHRHGVSCERRRQTQAAGVDQPNELDR